MKRFSYIFTSFIYLIYSYRYLEILGIIGIVWCAAWWFLVYDSPIQHPRISEEEKAYILQAIGDKVQNSKNSKVINILSLILLISASNAQFKLTQAPIFRVPRSKVYLLRSPSSRWSYYITVTTGVYTSPWPLHLNLFLVRLVST